MLSCDHLVKSYGKFKALDDFSLTLKAGKIYALLGPNGSGKTTFMKTVAGLVKQTSGEIMFGDTPIGVKSKAHIAYMPTESYFYAYMTGLDVGRYYRDFFADFDMERYCALMRDMDLDLQIKAAKMSSGMLAKLKLAATLSRNAELVMLDEPLNGIDIIAREKVITAILSTFEKHKTYVLSSHLVDELEKILDYAIFVKSGKVVLEGDAQELRAQSGKSIVDMYKEIYADSHT